MQRKWHGNKMCWCEIQWQSTHTLEPEYTVKSGVGMAPVSDDRLIIAPFLRSSIWGRTILVICVQNIISATLPSSIFTYLPPGIFQLNLASFAPLSSPSISSTSFFYGPDVLPVTQPCQITEGKYKTWTGFILSSSTTKLQMEEQLLPFMVAL